MIVTKFKKFFESKTATSSFWVALETISSQFLRLGGNLVLTKLLVPEMFGLMAIAASFIGFFGLISDVGLKPSIINSKRTEDPEFMKTAWTIQLLRSMFLATCLCICAYPISLFYESPSLFPVLLFLAFTVVISGFNSTAIILEQKHLRQKNVSLCLLGSQFLSLTAMITAAYFSKSIWALAIGNLVATTSLLVFSYTVFKTHHSKFTLEKQSAREIFHFGKWIILSSFFCYLTYQSAPAILGKLITMDELGVFVVALTLAAVIEHLSNKVSSSVLHARFRQLMSQNNFKALYKLRNTFNTGFLFAVSLIAIFGDIVIRTLYDERYADGEWAMQLLAVGKIATILSESAKSISLSLGDSKGLMYTQAGNAFITVSSLLLGNYLGGFEGIVIACAIYPFFGYLLISLRLKTFNVSVLRSDSAIALGALAFIALGWTVTNAPALTIIRSVLGD